MIKLIIESESLNFYWMAEGYKDFMSDEPFRVCWEDLDYDIIKDGEKIRSGCVTIDTKAMAKYELSRINSDFGDHMELKFPGYKEDELNAEIVDHLTWQGLIDSNAYHYQYCYSDVTDPEKYEIKDMINLPYNEYGMTPSYISMYVPEEWLTKDVVEKYMRLFIERFFGYTVDEIEWPVKISPDKLKKEYDDEVARIKEWETMREKGEKMRVILLPQVLSIFVDNELVKKWEARGLKSAEHLEDCDDYTLEFNDGHTELATQTPEYIEYENENNNE